MRWVKNVEMYAWIWFKGTLDNNDSRLYGEMEIYMMKKY